MTTGAQSSERYRFGLEGVAYLRSYLTRNAEFGGLLGRLLIRRKLESGSTWAFLPSGTSERARTSFETGGLAPAGDVHPMPDETVFVYIRTDALDAPVIAWATGKLESRESVLCVEDAIDRRHYFTGPASALALPTLFCGDHVYRYTHSGGADLAPVMRAARGALWQPHVGVITTRPASLGGSMQSGAEMSSDALEEMAGAARAIIIGAWDREAFLIWERRKAEVQGAATVRAPERAAHGVPKPP